MYYFELQDIMFFIKSLQSPTDNFNIYDYITFARGLSKTGLHQKLAHLRSQIAIQQHFSLTYNSLPITIYGIETGLLKPNLVPWCAFTPPFCVPNFNGIKLALVFYDNFYRLTKRKTKKLSQFSKVHILWCDWNVTRIMMLASINLLQQNRFILLKLHGATHRWKFFFLFKITDGCGVLATAHYHVSW